MKIIPTFNFSGQCEEALKLYKKAFNAEILCAMRYSDADPDDYHWDLAEEQKNYIYHAELLIGDQKIIMSDNIDVPFAPNLSSFLTVTFNTPEEVQNAYNILREESKTIYPLGKTSYSALRVVFTDKFGFRWGLMTE